MRTTLHLRDRNYRFALACNTIKWVGILALNAWIVYAMAFCYLESI